MQTQQQHIIMEHPGYTWVYREPHWVLDWTPIPGIYSPPCLHKPMRFRTVPVALDVLPMIGRVIGKEGKFLKWITERSKTTYIFFREGMWEIWGPSDRSLRLAVLLLEKHIQHHLELKNKMSGVRDEAPQEVHLESVEVGPIVE